MRPCKDHWTAMRAKIERCGISHLVADSGEEACERTVRSLEAGRLGDEPPVTAFDPLMDMLWTFYGKVTEGLGLYVMSDRGSEKDGMPENRSKDGFNHVCPLCVVRRDFDAHNTPTGRCTSAGCRIEVKPGETPWDEMWIDGCGDAMLQAAVEKGLVRRQ